jgi:2-polyprenyl-6-methoxyphenol hydroxylase-like FAD-dependent oxidoreductase
MMLGYLLARAGVRTVVLEKHADFLRDFRGDTVHPSTLRIMDELGLLDDFLKRPHQKLEVIGGWFGDRHVQLGDFRGLPKRYAFIAMVPQWEFLDFLADEATKLPTFSLRTRANVTGLIEGDGRIAGVRGTSPDGDFEIRADCTVGCDGRHSTCAPPAGLPVEDVGAPIDVLWFRVRRDPAEVDTSLARIAPGHFVVTIDPRRLLAVRVRHRQGRCRRAAPAADRRVPRPGRRMPGRCSPRTSTTTCARGTTSSCSPSPSTA